MMTQVHTIPTHRFWIAKASKNITIYWQPWTKYTLTWFFIFSMVGTRILNISKIREHDKLNPALFTIRFYSASPARIMSNIGNATKSKRCIMSNGNATKSKRGSSSLANDSSTDRFENSGQRTNIGAPNSSPRLPNNVTEPHNPKGNPVTRCNIILFCSKVPIHVLINLSRGLTDTPTRPRPTDNWGHASSPSSYTINLLKCQSFHY